MSCASACNRIGCIKKMLSYLVVLYLCAIEICRGGETDFPRVRQCRALYKAKPPTNAPSTWTEVYQFSPNGMSANSLFITTNYYYFVFVCMYDSIIMYLSLY